MHNFKFNIGLEISNAFYPNNPKTFAERLRKARMDKGLQSRELATKIGVRPETITNWEMRNIRPTRENLKKIKVFFDFI